MLFLGTFHFNIPGLDAAKVDTIKVPTPQVQTELEKITDEIFLFGE